MARSDGAEFGGPETSRQGAGLQPRTGTGQPGDKASPHGSRFSVIGRQRVNLRFILAALMASATVGTPAVAADAWRICLNWAPGADHAPLYLARASGAFVSAGLAPEIRPGGGSADAVNKLRQGACEAAVADFGAVAAVHGETPQVMAVFAIFDDAPLAFVARDRTRLTTPADLAGLRIASDEKELARRLWPAFARRNGLEHSSVTWIQTPNNAKVDALQDDSAQAATNTFYHHLTEFSDAFGTALTVMPYREHGINPYTQVVAVSARTIAEQPRQVAAFVRLLRASHQACIDAPDACITALTDANPHLDTTLEHRKWRVAARLIAPPGRLASEMGRLDRNRVIAHHGAHAATAFTNRFLEVTDASAR